MSFLFFFKKKPIILDCYTSDSPVKNYAAPKYAAGVMPDWWKSLEKDIAIPEAASRMATIKRCTGVHMMVKSSLVLPMWCDFDLQLGPIGTTEYKYKFAGVPAKLVEHPPAQRGAYLPNANYQHLKIITPWRLKCRENIQWMISQATWSYEKPDEVFVPPAVVDFKYQCDVNVNAFFVRKNYTHSMLIPYGQPLVYITPLSDRAVDIRTHLVSTEELDALTLGPRLKFVNNYRTVLNAANEKSKCPFSGVFHGTK